MAVQLTPVSEQQPVDGGFFARIQREMHNRNRDVALQLRDVANWLLEHPELPEVRFATVSLRSIGDDSTHIRRDLDVVAHALLADDYEVLENHRRLADSSPGEPDTYEIVGVFGPARVIASAAVGELTFEDGIHPDDGPPAPILESYREHEDPYAMLLRNSRRYRTLIDATLAEAS